MRTIAIRFVHILSGLAGLTRQSSATAGDSELSCGV